MNIKELSDFQLYSLVMSNEQHSIDSTELEKEFKARNFPLQKLDEMGMKLKKIKNAEILKGLNVSEIVLIVAFPFFAFIQIMVANKYVKNGTKRKLKQHWNYMGLGYLLWTILVILLAKHFIFN